MTDPDSSEAPARTGLTNLGADYLPPEINEVQALLPHLEILSFIGHGGMGTFYQARQPKLDRFVAVKLLPVDTGADAFFIESFKREAGDMAKLIHPNIIGIYDFGHSDSLVYLVMEFVTGDILERLIGARNFSLPENLAIVAQICDALSCAHQQGVIHRDIRPGNTMLNDEGHVKVGDFGLARLVGEELFRRNLTEANRAMGSMDYVAPEQHEPGKTVDHRADIYSVGMMLYKLLTHTLPRGTFVPPSSVVPDLDPRLDEIVVRCMQRDPQNRYQDITEVRAAVDHLRIPPSADPPGVKFKFPES